MKLILIIAILILSGCSGAMVKEPPCDSVANRDKEFVCGKSDVVKNCSRVVDRQEWVCDPL